jgi:hypothetical protein
MVAGIQVGILYSRNIHLSGFEDRVLKTNQKSQSGIFG